MAKHKGKSKRRIKDWHQRAMEGGLDVDQQFVRQSLSKRGVKLPPRQLDVGEEALADLPRVQGMVTGLYPGGVEVRTDEGDLLCMIAKTFRSPEGTTALTVGDIVTIAMTRDSHIDAIEQDKDRSDGMILTRQPRRTALSRPQPRSGKRRDQYKSDVFEKVIAANMDVLLIVAATKQPPLRHGLIDRFLIIAQRGELTPLLVVNKIDLAKPDAKLIEEFRSLGLTVLLVSAATGEGVDELRPLLQGRQSILAGASGVGKSTLINRIIPEANAATRTVRKSDERGRHTTSATSIYEFPGGGRIVDTPGIRELGLRIAPTDLPWYFPEFEEYARQCHFNNCTHLHEPDCAVLQAVEAEIISPRRYDSYLRLMETLES